MKIERHEQDEQTIMHMPLDPESTIISSATITDTFTQLGRFCPPHLLTFYSSLVIPITIAGCH
jgi:hypothetical protein